MTFSDFTLASAETLLGLNVIPGDLFPGRQREAVPSWLNDRLARGRSLALTTEKARSEFLVAPVLSAACELTGDAMTIYSGESLDVDSGLGLTGVCDFILSVTPPVPRLKSPLVVVHQARHNDIDEGLGPCIAQMFASARFLARSNESHDVYGCVTSGELWRFLRLRRSEILLDRDQFFITNVSGLLSMFQGMARTCVVA